MNDGFINESIMREYINNNTFDKYNSNIKKFLVFLFENNISTDIPFIATKEGGQVKPDLSIKHNGIVKYVSIKKGSGNSVHQEKIEVFFPFVEEYFDKLLLNDLKKFHYGDDTIDDTGEKRYNANECKNRYIKEIEKLNLNFNKKENLLLFLNRFLFVGNISSVTVDAIYHGTIISGLWASRDEIVNYILNNNFLTNAIHFGPLTYQVWGRNEKGMAIHPERRYVMQVKWGCITKDLQSIRDENNV